MLFFSESEGNLVHEGEELFNYLLVEVSPQVKHHSVVVAEMHYQLVYKEARVEQQTVELL